ncbi:hypothetical protein OMK68_22010 [Rhodococcus pyridinivorans]|uniref:hypothetical protein n=1 Tax=Rhodococcus pyridinivorans TaxID=103816 RepID=UPI002226A172|nr:hypothetical protein [Rhodococcus pyridinivorans]MCW3472269.1 hypothetical protein [Rhodococcus pyridinivorans]
MFWILVGRRVCDSAGSLTSPPSRAAAATAAEHTRRLEGELTAARTVAAAERDRAETARADAAAAHAQAEAARERVAELRAELQDLRTPPAGP